MNNTTDQSWKQRGETTNRFWLTLLWAVCRLLGRDVTRWTLLLVITAIYFVADRGARHHSRDFLCRAGRPHQLPQVFEHMFVFATVAMDRMFILGGREALFNVEIIGEDAFADLSGGALLVTSHFGSFDIMRVLAREQQALDIRILLDIEHNAQTLSVVKQLNPELATMMIDAGKPGPALVLRLADEISQGHLIGIMADRVQPGQTSFTTNFLSAPAAFPLGPWAFAAVLKCPVILCFGTFLGGRRYQLAFSRLDMSQLPGRRREVAQAALVRYVEELEDKVEKAPLNWFNFYSFWQ